MTQGSRSLAHRTAAGVAWISVFQVAKQLLSVISVSIVARRVPPAAYGLMAMAALVTNFLEVFRDMGTAFALVREPHVSEELASTVSWLNWGLGGLITLLVAAFSWPVAKFFHEPQVATILQLLSVAFFMGAISVVPRALLSREMAFREISVAQTAGVISGTIVTVGIALAGGKVWSLVFGSLATTATTTLAILFYSPLKLKSHFRLGEARHIISFGMNMSGYQFLNYFSRNADNLLVGRFLGSGPLGFYQMAYTLMTYPLQNFTFVITQVVYPALAKFQDDHERFRSAYLRTCRIIALGTFPLMLGLAVTAVPFVRVFLGARWMPVATLLSIFAPLGALQSITVVGGLIYNTQGRPDINFRWTLFASAMYVSSFIVGLHWGIFGVAASYSIVWTVLMIPSLLIPFRLVKLSLKSYFGALWPTIWMSLVMAAVSEAWLWTMRHMGVYNAALQGISTAAIGATVYMALLLWRKPPVLFELSSIVAGSSHPLARMLARILVKVASTPKVKPVPAATSSGG